MNRYPALFAVSAFFICSFQVGAEDSDAIFKLNESAQQAFDQGKFKKAELSWTRSIKAMEDNGQKDTALEASLKRLGQTYKKMERAVEAYRYLSRALDMCRQLNLQDAELAQELTELSTVYRAVDVSELGEGTAKALRKANVAGVGLVKTNTGNVMRVDLPEKFDKQLDSDTVDGLSFDKSVTLNLAEESDGTVSLTNIKGFRIHSKEKNMWVNLLQAIIKPADASGEHPADVTAGKMGVTKTVSASLPAKGFEPLTGLLKQLRLLGTPVPVAFTGNAPGAVPAATPGAAPEAIPVAAPEAIPVAEAASTSTNAKIPFAMQSAEAASAAPSVVADSSPAAAGAETQSTLTRPANISCEKLFSETEKIVKTYYPRAKFKRSGNKLHFEFKSRIDMVRPPEINGEAQPEKQEVVADWGGVVGDLELKAGKYTGTDNMPMLLKNRSSYEVYLNAPYSEKFDYYLSVRLAYPFDANADFLKSFKEQCLGFENDLISE